MESRRREDVNALQVRQTLNKGNSSAVADKCALERGSSKATRCAMKTMDYNAEETMLYDFKKVVQRAGVETREWPMT